MIEIVLTESYREIKTSVRANKTFGHNPDAIETQNGYVALDYTSKMEIIDFEIASSEYSPKGKRTYSYFIASSDDKSPPLI